jgi:hypothetical protein
LLSFSLFSISSLSICFGLITSSATVVVSWNYVDTGRFDFVLFKSIPDLETTILLLLLFWWLWMLLLFLNVNFCISFTFTCGWCAAVICFFKWLLFNSQLLLLLIMSNNFIHHFLCRWRCKLISNFTLKNKKYKLKVENRRESKYHISLCIWMNNEFI